MKKVTILFWIVFFCLFMTAQSVLFAQVIQQDSLALVDFYQSTHGENWTDNSHWLSGPVSTWYGITIFERRVVGINLYLNNLVGSISEKIGDLTELQSLDLHSNSLSGEIPEEIVNLKNLDLLYLWQNQLTGKIPTFLGELTKLTSLSLGTNLFTGDIPAEISNLKNMELLNLGENQLTGHIPDEIGDLTNLTILVLSRNKLTGPIPPSIGNLTNLTLLYLFANQLDGAIPADIGNLINLTNLSCYFNLLSGPIPSQIGNLTKLTTLSFRENKLTGHIPSIIGNLKQIQTLDLQNNQLTGEIPTSISQLTRLVYLYLGQNQLTGDIPAGITNLAELYLLQIPSNFFTSLPDLSHNSKLNVLEIQNNRFTFEDIEPNMGIPTFLYWPQDSVGIKEEKVVELDSSLALSVDVGGSHNQYQWYKDGFELLGATSDQFLINSASKDDQGSYTCRISNTIVPGLTLYSRPINVIMHETFNIESDSLALVALYNSTNGVNWTNNENWLSGRVTTWFGVTVTDNRVTEINLPNNNLRGPLSSEIGNLNNLYNINLSGNFLTGEIPREIGNLSTLYNLFLSVNLFEGNIPVEVTKMDKLSSLYIGSNNLSGLPDLSSMATLTQIYIENNKLTFEDLEPNMGIPEFYYSPQDCVGIKQDMVLQQGENLTLAVSVGGTANKYQWFKDDVDILSATSNEFEIASANADDSGVYICQITNTLVPDLTLYSRPFKVKVSGTDGIFENNFAFPQNFALYQNYPNPFNPNTTIEYGVKEACKVVLKVYDIGGNEVATLVNINQQPGTYRVTFNARNLATGVYFYRIQMNNFVAVCKMMLLQ